MALKATALFAMLGLAFALSPPIEANVDPHFDKFMESISTDKAELILEKETTKMKDILTSNYTY